MTVSWVPSLYLAQENIFQAGVYNIEKKIVLKYLMDQSIINNENILEQKYKKGIIGKDLFWNNLEKKGFILK